MTNTKAVFLLGALVLTSGCAGAGDGASEGAVDTTQSGLTIDPAIAVPAGNVLLAKASAYGDQIYVCAATATAFAWTFKAPQASLFIDSTFVGTHYAGPTWRALDGSTVTGAKLAAVTPDPTAIPWLLLKGTGSGSGTVGAVTYVQRLQTTGGLAPTSACAAANVNAEAHSSYTAKYAFYRAQ